METKKTIHFVYATPHSRTDRLAMRVFHRKLTHPSWENYKWPTPIPAPLSITYHLAKALSEHFEVKLYDLRERMSLRPNNGDILLGHPWPDPNSIVWKALESNLFEKKYIISPYNHDPNQVQWAYKAIKRCDTYFALCGQYWIDTFDKSLFADFREKVVRVNMGIDVGQYPVVKKKFNLPGKRKFFYVGRAGDEKGLDLLEKLAADVPGFEGGYICNGADIKGWKKLSEPRRLTQDFMAMIATEYDIFINMSRFDAQVTTVLEAMSWGFPVACTPQSGYSNDKNLFYLDLEDGIQNRLVVQQLQDMDCQELENISRINRKNVELNNTWEQFIQTFKQNI